MIRKNLATIQPVLSLLAAVLIVSLGARSAHGVEIPPNGSVFFLQTSGPNAGLTIGDWYSATDSDGGVSGGMGYNYTQIFVPPNWPTTTSIHIDLFSPDLATGGTSGVEDEIRNGADTTEFELYAPGGPNVDAATPTIPAPGTGIGGTQITYNSGDVGDAWTRYHTLTAPVATGTYFLRAETSDDDDNSWRLRVGSDDDSDASNTPPSNNDNPDGVFGTGDELVVGLRAMTYQQASPDFECLIFFQYVAPGIPATFNNFDLDGGSSTVRYYAPSDVFDPTGQTGGTVGTVSADSNWNNSSTAGRVGDTFPTPERGWWRIVTCLNNSNQFIQEAASTESVFFEQPPTPQLDITIDDGVVTVGTSTNLTYTVTFTNTTSQTDPTAGAAFNNVITITVPSDINYQSGSVSYGPGYSGTVDESGISGGSGSFTVALDQSINAGVSSSFTFDAITDNPPGSFTTTSDIDYTDMLGNTFPQETDNDTDNVQPLFVELESFDALLSEDGSAVDVIWVTAIELDNAGFNLYRAVQDRSGEWQKGEKLNASLIPAQAFAGDGADYIFRDPQPAGRHRSDVRSYLLEDIDLFGVRTLHGPASVNAGRDVVPLRVVGWEDYQ
jgi:hypothetical protein